MLFLQRERKYPSFSRRSSRFAVCAPRFRWRSLFWRTRAREMWARIFRGYRYVCSARAHCRDTCPAWAGGQLCHITAVTISALIQSPNCAGWHIRTAIYFGTTSVGMGTLVLVRQMKVSKGGQSNQTGQPFEMVPLHAADRRFRPFLATLRPVPQT